MRNKHNNRGVTLVELVIALAVLAMLMVAVIMLMSNNTVIYRKTKADISVQTVAQETYGSIQDSIMQAKEVTLIGYTESDGKPKAYKKASLLDTSETVKKYEEVAFDKLSSSEVIYPTQLIIKYSVKSDAENRTVENDNCVITYYFCRYNDRESGHEKCNVYITRDYDPSVGISDIKWGSPSVGEWTPEEKELSSTSADVEKYKDYLYTSALSEATVKVDAEAQTFDLNLAFWDRGQSYTSKGIVRCRNSYVTIDMKSRLDKNKNEE